MEGFDWWESFLVGDNVFIAGFKGFESDVFGDVEADDFVCLDFEEVKLGVVLKSH